jgi:putative transposase
MSLPSNSPQGLQPKAKRALREMMYAATRAEADELIDRFAAVYEPKYPKATECLVSDREAPFTHFAFPAEHWLHLRTTNPVESAFATVRLRQRVTKGAGSRTKGLTMAFKLLAMAEQRWRRVNGAHLLPLLRAGVRFVDGVPVERQQEQDRKDAA